MAVDALGERPADALDLGDIVDRRGLHAAQAAEMLDQRLAALGADAGNLVQHRGRALFAPPRAVANDGEAVRLVADRLDEMQRRMRRRELQTARARLDDQLLQSGLALGPLRHADEAYLVQAEIGEHGTRDADLAFAAVDQYQVWNLAGLPRDALVAAREHLAHRAVIVARRDAADVEPPILRLLHLLPVVDDARGDRRLAHRMADVEAFDAPRALGQAEHVA